MISSKIEEFSVGLVLLVNPTMLKILVAQVDLVASLDLVAPIDLKK
jgi:hypothetical protein